MAYFSGVVRSKALGMDTHLEVILPQDEREEKAPKVLYLLHGQGSGSASFVRYTNIATLARKYGFCVIIPEVQRSFYLDMAYGLAYQTYVGEELPVLCRKLFHLSDKGENQFLAGFSMGGYGALRTGLSRGVHYGGIASISGLCDLKAVADAGAHLPQTLTNEMRGILGDGFCLRAEDDLYHLMAETAKREMQPKIITCCGKQDHALEVDLYGQNLAFAQHAQGLALQDFTFLQWDGVHDWTFCNEAIEKIIPLFFQDK